MKKIVLIALFICSMSMLVIPAQTPQGDIQYRRSSLYSMMVSHQTENLSKEIEKVFLQIPIPDKFNNHDLAVKVVTTSEKTVNEETISSFLHQNQVARRVVARWFNRDPKTGECDMSLVAERGLYNASMTDIELAKMSHRGYSLLADAGEDLINNTFVIVNDIKYVDKSKGAKVGGAVVGGVLSFVGSLFGLGDLGDLVADGVNALISSVKGFGVTVTSYLYRMEWNDEIAATFYNDHYLYKGQEDAVKLVKFQQSDLYKLNFVGKQSVVSAELTMKSAADFDPYAVIRAVCARAIDESIIALQRNHDEFKIKSPIVSVEPEITAFIGLKEGVNERNRYEVLEPRTDENGKRKYVRVGVVQPVKGKIWDNRYMAAELGDASSTVSATTFRKISGLNFVPGMLLREIKVK